MRGRSQEEVQVEETSQNVRCHHHLHRDTGRRQLYQKRMHGISTKNLDHQALRNIAIEKKEIAQGLDPEIGKDMVDKFVIMRKLIGAVQDREKELSLMNTIGNIIVTGDVRNTQYYISLLYFTCLLIKCYYNIITFNITSYCKLDIHVIWKTKAICGKKSLIYMYITIFKQIY